MPLRGLGAKAQPATAGQADCPGLLPWKEQHSFLSGVAAWSGLGLAFPTCHVLTDLGLLPWCSGSNRGVRGPQPQACRFQRQQLQRSEARTPVPRRAPSRLRHKSSHQRQYLRCLRGGPSNCLLFLQDSLPLPAKWDNKESHMEREQDPDTISHVMSYIRQQYNLLQGAPNP